MIKKKINFLMKIVGLVMICAQMTPINAMKIDEVSRYSLTKMLPTISLPSIDSVKSTIKNGLEYKDWFIYPVLFGGGIYTGYVINKYLSPYYTLQPNIAALKKEVVALNKTQVEYVNMVDEKTKNLNENISKTINKTSTEVKTNLQNMQGEVLQNVQQKLEEATHTQTENFNIQSEAINQNLDVIEKNISTLFSTGITKKSLDNTAKQVTLLTNSFAKGVERGLQRLSNGEEQLGENNEILESMVQKLIIPKGNLNQKTIRLPDIIHN